MGGSVRIHIETKKRGRLTERQFNTAVYLLRCYQIGLRLSDLAFLEYCEVQDMLIESGNDGEQYAYIATQEDMDRL